MRKLIPLAWMILLLSGAFFLDWFYKQTQDSAFRAFDLAAIASLLWLKLGFHLAFTAAILALAWYMLLRSDRSILVSSVYLLVGLFVSVLLTIPGYRIVSGYLGPFALHTIVEHSLTSIMGLAANASAFVAILGLVGLVLRAAPGILPLPAVNTPMARHTPTGDLAR